VDCYGFVNLVYHAAGLQEEGSHIGYYTNRKSIGEESATYRSAEAQYVEKNKNTSLYAKEWMPFNFTHANVATKGDIYNLFYSNKLEWSNEAKPGDVIFMHGHIGIYGFDEAGKHTFIHSDTPFPAGQNPPDYSSGPRVQKFADFNKVSTENDSYTNWMIGQHKFEYWTNNYTFRYARWKY
jgi:cell wall-associated NlpC family hydrolase